MAKTSTKVKQLKINYLSKDQYNEALEAGEIQSDELYFTPSNEIGIGTVTTPGTVKSGGDITIDSTGLVSVNDNSHDHTISNITGLQDELDGKATSEQGAKADSAIQKADISTGTINGTIAVRGTNVIVKGLDSAAYAKTTDFDAAGVAETKVNTLANGAVATNTSDIETLKGKVETLESVNYVEIPEDEIDTLFLLL